METAKEPRKIVNVITFFVIRENNIRSAMPQFTVTISLQGIQRSIVFFTCVTLAYCSLTLRIMHLEELRYFDFFWGKVAQALTTCPDVLLGNRVYLFSIFCRELYSWLHFSYLQRYRQPTKVSGLNRRVDCNISHFTRPSQQKLCSRNQYFDQ